jgi:serpin B
MVAASTALRVTDPAVAPGSLAALVRDNTNAGLELLRRGGDPGASFALSPQSLQLALAMTYEGARGTTESQMATALRWSLPKAELHAAFNALDQQLGKNTSSSSVNLHVVNALFGQTSFAFQQPFVDTVAAHYGAPLSRLDFAANPGAARTAINAWVKRETGDEIPELLAPDDITSSTEIALCNAIRFVAQWKIKFDAKATRPAPFTQLDGTQRQLPTMVEDSGYNLARRPDWDAIELLYQGDAVSMLIVLPKRESFTTFVAGLDHAQLAQIDASLELHGANLELPKFELRAALPAAPVLQAMGMIDAFNPGAADLSGIAGAPGDLYISKVVHQAVVRVDEDGTRAAAATAVIGTRGGIAPESFKVDRPFLFFIRDKATGAVLFMGRFMGTT